MVDQLARQVDHQIALSHTAAEHNIVDSHRELFLNILQDEYLLKIFADQAKVSPDKVRKRLLGTFLINHCLTIFHYHSSRVIKETETENFVRDARTLFMLPFLRERWAEVKSFHPVSFQTFVDKVLLIEGEVDLDHFSPTRLGQSTDPS